MIKRIISEWRLPAFSTVDAEGRSIDVQMTFQPAPEMIYAGVKLFLTLYSIGSIIWEFMDPAYEVSSIWIAYLTNWAQVVSVIYLILSFLLSASAFLSSSSSNSHSRTEEEHEQQGQEQDQEHVQWQEDHVMKKELSSLSIWHKITWAAFLISFNVEVFVVLLYWGLVYTSYTIPEDKKIYYSTVFAHGILLLVVGFDGLVLNRTPVRFRQIGFAYIVPILFLIWSLIHSTLDIGNPDKEGKDPEADDDAIYTPLNWKQRPTRSLTISLILTFVGVPLMFLAVWFISILSPHRYAADNGNGLQDEEEN